MTSQTLTNWTIRDVVMKTSSRRTSNYFRNNSRDKPSFKKAGKVCFAENLETVHEVPYNYDIYNKSNLRLKLPDIEVHKYTPLVCRDPYARPSKRKLRDKLADMFISDTFKLPFIREDVTKKITPTKVKIWTPWVKHNYQNRKLEPDLLTSLKPGTRCILNIAILY